MGVCEKKKTKFYFVGAYESSNWLCRYTRTRPRSETKLIRCVVYTFRDVARLINWLGTAGPLAALIECLTVILEYIDLFQFLLVGHSQLLVGLGPYQAHPWLRLCIHYRIYVCVHRFKAAW